MQHHGETEDPYYLNLVLNPSSRNHFPLPFPLRNPAFPLDNRKPLSQQKAVAGTLPTGPLAS